MKNLLAIGYVKSAHGVRGNIRVCSFSGESEHFYNLEELTLRRGRKKYIFKIENVSGRHPTLIIKLKGVETREDALKYKGWEILVPRENASPCGDGEYYIADLVGCKLYTDSQTPDLVGTVLSIVEAANADLLEVEKTDGEKIIIPFQDYFIGHVDITEKKIKLKTPWILE